MVCGVGRAENPKQLENGGVVFIDENGGGPGVRLRQRSSPRDERLSADARVRARGGRNQSGIAALVASLSCLSGYAGPSLIALQSLLNAAEEHLRSLVQDQGLGAHGSAELDRVRGEHDDLGAADELLDARLRLVLEMGISGADALIDQQ